MLEQFDFEDYKNSINHEYLSKRKRKKPPEWAIETIEDEWETVTVVIKDEKLDGDTSST